MPFKAWLLISVHMRIIRFSQTDSAKDSSIELSFKRLGDLIDQDDPSPFALKEVTEVAEDAITEHIGDLPLKRNVEFKHHSSTGRCEF